MSKQTKIIFLIVAVVVIAIAVYFFMSKPDESITTKTSTGLAGSGGIGGIVGLFI